VPWELAAVVGKMMAKEPARRYQTPSEVAQALKPFFKAGETGPVASKAELSQVGQPPDIGRTARPGLRGATNVAPAPPQPTARKTVKSTQPEPKWQNLIVIEEAEPKPVPLKAAASARGWPRPHWLWPTVGVGVLLIGITIVWVAAVLTKRTKGTVEKQPAAPASPTAAARARQPSTAWTSPSTKIAFVRLEGGEFMMGSPASDEDADHEEKPQHNVRISPFLLGVTEVTQSQHMAVMGTNPSHFSKYGGGKDQVAGQSTDRHPVETVSWLDAIKYCNALSKQDRLMPYYDIAGDNVRVPIIKGPGYRLPTEAEWEYACRAGKESRYSFGDDQSEMRDYAWCVSNAASTTHPVGEKRPNDFGLYDMHGNVWEWCWDWFDNEYYARSPADDPSGPSGASDRVIRGGGWCRAPRNCRSAGRDWDPPAKVYNVLGFRLALRDANLMNW